MQTKNQYGPLTQNQYYIDKTEALEKGIVAFPSIYIEGAAASGKTTAVRMLLAKHPEVRAVVFWMDEERKNPSEFAGRLRELEDENARRWNEKEYTVDQREREEIRWIIFENLNGVIPVEMLAEMIRFTQNMPREDRVILIGRDRPEEGLLELFWKRQMEIISQETFLFSKEEISRLAEYSQSMLKPEKIYEETAGWAGCVDIMLRMSERNAGQDVEELRNSYEINTYIRKEILGALSAGEQEMMRRAAVCPWVDEALCADVWDIPHAADILERLVRKGMLVHNRSKKRWKMAALFRKNYQYGKKEDGWYQTQGFWKRLGEWYEKSGCIKEALQCFQESGDADTYRRYMIKYFHKIPFLGIAYKEVLEWKDSSPEIIYLRGMYAYFLQNQEGLQKELRRLEKLEKKDQCSKEIYLNLMYVNPAVSLDEWMILLEQLSKNGDPLRLYGMLGGSVTYLCGMRDLSGLFACTRKEENRKARIWKDNLGEMEWLAYRFARIDYYMETERLDALKEEDRILFDRMMGEKGVPDSAYERIPWQIRLAGLYLLCKRQMMGSEAELNERIQQLERSLRNEEVTTCVRNAEAVSSVYSPWRKESEKLTRWLRYADQERNIEIREDNYYYFCCQAKGYLLLGQYEKAGKILRRTIPYLRNNKHYRYLAEVLFQQALINWEAGRHSQALQSVIESFLVSGDSRYVGFYTSYGKRGKNVLDAYIGWLHANSPEGWHRKKKYNYGNVLRMPMQDYMEVILRCIKRESRNSQVFLGDVMEERLTMMETIILQDIARGLTNAEICQELNLRLPTVKSHIYSLYKKLGANSRVQAVLKGKEKGILE